MSTKIFLSLIFCILNLVSLGQQPKKINADKKEIILDLINRIKGANSNPRNESEVYMACLIDTRERVINHIQSPVYYGILYGDYKTNLELIDSLQETSRKRLDLFLEHDSIYSFKNYVITYPRQDSFGLKKARGTSWYLEINRPIEGWENLTLYDNMHKGFYDDSVSIRNYSREYLSIPVIVFKLYKGVLNQQALMFVYRILYKESKVQFVREFSF